MKDFDLPNTFNRAPVRIGQTNDRRVEILGGLFPGDEVVTKGAYALGFAGGSGPSLKEALDAAHGHEHNADGSEMTAAQKAAGHGHDHGHGDEKEHEEASPLLTRFLMGTTAILFVLLVIVSFGKRRHSHPEAT